MSSSSSAREAELYPAFLKLAGRHVVIVGNGPVAAAKLKALHAAGARVSVIDRAFVPSDLDGAWFVVAAATPGVNRAVTAAAEERRIFVNAVDDPSNATAYLGGVVRRSGVTIAVSTGGEAPALAGLLREALDLLLPDDTNRWLEVARAQRRRWQARGIPIESRRPLLLEALNSLYGPSSREEVGA